jgi:hypothetical protein
LKFLLLFFCTFFPAANFAQQKKILHKPQTSIVIPGLRRAFDAELAAIHIEVNPGWQGEEIEDSTEKIYQLIFTDPEDSSKKILSLLMQHYESKGFDSTQWERLKKSIRISYGDRGIAVRPLSEQMTDEKARDSTGVLAFYELLTRHTDFIEYVYAIVGQRSLLLLSAPLKTEEYQQKVPYFQSVAGSIRLGKSK